MKKILAVLLVLCMMTAFVPVASAAQNPTNDASIPTVRPQACENGSPAISAARNTIQPQAEQYASYMFHVNTVNMNVLAGNPIDIRAVAHVPTVQPQLMYLNIYKGAEPTEDGYVSSYYIDFGSETGYFNVTFPIEESLSAGTYCALLYTIVESGGEDALVEDSIVGCNFTITNQAVPANRVYFKNMETQTEITELNLAKGYDDVTNVVLSFDPANTTDSRKEQYLSPTSDLEVYSFGGYLGAVAHEYGCVSVLADVGGNSAYLTVNICTDDAGHDYEDIVLTEPTCTEEGYAKSVCKKCNSQVGGHSIPATGHTWDEGQILVEETEDAPGRALYTCTVCGVSEEMDYHTCPGAAFTDMPAYSDWSHKGIEYAIRNGLMVGMTDTLFQPYINLTRGQLVTILWRQAGSPEPQNPETPFTDLNKNYYLKAVAWAYETGVVKGITETTFRPDQNVTREQFATFAYRYAANVLHLDVSAQADLTAYPDHDKISNFAKASMVWANAIGLISGVKNGDVITLQPKEGATRAQAATILMRFCQMLEELPEQPEQP